MEGTLNLYYHEQFIRANKYKDNVVRERILNVWRHLYGKRIEECEIIDVPIVLGVIKQKSPFKKGSLIHLKTPSHKHRKYRGVFTYNNEGFK